MHKLGHVVQALGFGRAFRNEYPIALSLLAALSCTPIDDVGKHASSTQDQGDAGTSGTGGVDAAMARAGSGDDRASSSGGSGGAGAGHDGGGASKAIAGDGAGANVSGMAGHGGASGSDDNGPAAGGGGDAPLPDDPPLSREPLDPSQTSIVPETADAQTMARLSDWSALPVLGSGKYQMQSSQDRGVDNSGEQMLLPVTAHGNRDLDNFICKSADADTGSGAVVAYAYDSTTCPDAYVRGVVMARFEGSGFMSRLWMTVDALFSNQQIADEVLRIYIDDNPRAAIQMPLEQVLTGGAGEIFTLPFGATSRAFIAWHYPVVFNSKLVVAIDRLSEQYYYQVDAVLDAQPQRRASPRQRMSQRDAAHALLVGASPVPATASSLHSEQLTLAAGEQRAVPLTGPATIDELRLRVPADKLSSLAAVHIAARWDGASQAAIDVPVLDLFAASQAVIATPGLALAASSDGGTQLLALRLPMPFQARSDWTITNGSNATVDFQLEWVGEARVPSAAFGHLNVQANDTTLPATQLEQTIAQANGPGRFIGVCGDLGGHADRSLGSVSTNLDLLQGDFRATADGQRVLGSTGTEDYVDSAFYFRDSPKATPFAQNWGRVDDNAAKPPGQISFCRWQVLGAEIDFQHDFKAIHEIAQFDTTIVERHHTLAFLYLP